MADKTCFIFFVLIYCKKHFLTLCYFNTHSGFYLFISILFILVLISLSEAPSSGMAKNGYFYQEMGEWMFVGVCSCVFVCSAHGREERCEGRVGSKTQAEGNSFLQ